MESVRAGDDNGAAGANAMSRENFANGVLLLLAFLALAMDARTLNAQTAAPSRDSTAEAARDDFFEKTVRPILVEHCVSCHGPQKLRGGLRLDSAQGFDAGSENGAIAVPGNPGQSLLIQAVRHDGPVKMPPKRKLSEQSIAALTAWVEQGARWPAEAPATRSSSQRAAPHEHWAFQPVQKPAIPRVKDQAWPATPVDSFVLARLEAVGLAPSPAADRRTLIRRATFDLHGLPPTPDETAAFEADPAPDAFARVVERLLASPRYGERWGRHWLDVARYSDTKGYVRLNENPNYVCGWTYRDYVIRAFNEDLPYDRFLTEQLAADLIAQKDDDPRPLAALGFLTLGERFINSQHDIIDDRIDVVSRGLLGLTVSCARCHDHKFDPIPTEDYYSLHGIFANSHEPRVPPLIVAPADRALYADYLKGLQERSAEFDAFLREQQAKLTAAFLARAGDYLVAAQKEQVQANFLAVMFLVDASKDLNPVMLQRWCRLLAQTRKQPDSIWTPWHRLAALPDGDLRAQLPGLLSAWQRPDESAPINAAILAGLGREPLPSNLAEVAARYGEVIQAAHSRSPEAQDGASAAIQSPDPAGDEIRQRLLDPAAPLAVGLDDVEEFLFVDTTTQNLFHAQQRNIEDWIASPGAAPHAMVLEDSPVSAPARIFIRGNASNPGAVVPRRFLALFSRGERSPFDQGSGRLELARAIANRQNPLTPRVLVNRVWMHHFGSGLVRTPSDFGVRGEPPTHPELLDWLATEFAGSCGPNDGAAASGGGATSPAWSLKNLHRLILLSSTYQQQSGDNPRGHERDPENMLLWRANRRRLDWEALRDSLLALSGALDSKMGGPSVKLTEIPLSARRTVYGHIDRQNLPGVLRTFDFASPEASSPQRHQTTVPQQALFLMNSPFLREQAHRLAARADLPSPSETAARIEALHRLVYSRGAESAELELGRTFVAGSQSAETGATAGGAQPPTAWDDYAQVLLLANEFQFVD